ncbi:MAG: shikimate kinase [Bacteroidales bacterium]|jgi:shikimate kinase
MIIFLLGFMGSGKSTVGQRLAGRLGYSFIDMDARLEGEHGMTINEIFEKLGEKAFRDLESNLLKEMVSLQDAVISTGGGLPCTGNNMDLINRKGVSIYLRMEPAALLNRLSRGKSRRPLIRHLSRQELETFIQEKLREREPVYLRAHHIISGLNFKMDELMEIL